MVDLYSGEGLDDLDEILFQHGVVESSEMVSYERIGAEFVSVVTQGFLVFFQRAVRVCACDGFHSFEVLAGVFDCLLAGHQLVHVVGEVEHNFAEEHVLERCGCFLGLILGVVAIERFDEIGVCGVEVLVFCVELAGLHVQTCLQQRWCVH